MGLLVELLDHLNGRIPGRADAVPVTRLVTRHEIAHSRDIRQRPTLARAKGEFKFANERERDDDASTELPNPLPLRRAINCSVVS
jgi:hypothetical protein